MTAMQDLRSLLPHDKLARLRAAYDHDSLLKANTAAIETIAPQLAGWNRAVEATFYAAGNPLKPIDRERCLIGLITLSGPAVSLAIHVYWGLMEGIGVEEMTHIIALAGCYGGQPRAMFGIETMHRTLRALAAIELAEGATSTAAIEALVRELART